MSAQALYFLRLRAWLEAQPDYPYFPYRREAELYERMCSLGVWLCSKGVRV